ncbi:CLUMA_CG007055, isoform A [Clunio marinus]|uniref:CLUMA_CG007055, isoform A n=1 Tax=Clunio marinus TaxID=568069 RepID=A0A1J1I189_9DIPT|nr:CLUMA_CG007055, isoform A [Clunio marinus]
MKEVPHDILRTFHSSSIDDSDNSLGHIKSYKSRTNVWYQKLNIDNSFVIQQTPKTYMREAKKIKSGSQTRRDWAL